METEDIKRENKAQEPEYIQRFPVRERVEHIVLMVTFVALVLTGLIQRFYTAGFSEWMILHLGGIQTTRLIHRAFGFFFTAIVVYHFAFVNFHFFAKHGKLTMMPTLRDFRDVIDTLKRGLGLRAPAPQFGRFDYRQKFEYVGMIVGSVILIVTGFILIYPVAVTQVLPGQVVAAAVTFHGFEATLALLTIIIWHFYDVIFRPGIFPADTSIFTGKISRKRMEEEHPLEYQELWQTKPEKTSEVTPAKP